MIYNTGTSTNTDYYEFIKKLQDCQGYTLINTAEWTIKNPANKTDDKKETEETNKKVEITLCNYIPKKIYFNGPVTVVVWDDGTKTRVRRHDGDPDNRYSAFCAALAKKIFGNNTVVNKIVNTGIYCSSNKATKEKEGTK